VSHIGAKAIRTVGVSRHAAAPALRKLSRTAPISVARQATALLAGSVCIGVAVSLLLHAHLGFAP
jgi:hypothetical protein